jgi:GMP synthase (glutamine-hydrolysing)
MQAISLIFGETLVKNKEIGMVDVKTKIENPLFMGDFKAYCIHTKTVKGSNKKTLRSFEILAGSKDCIEAIKHKEKPVYGVLFHPEVRNPEIIVSFLKIS